MPRRVSLLMLCLALGAACPAAHSLLAPPALTVGADRLSAQQAVYDQAADPVAKAKALAKLQPGVFQEAQEALDAGDDVGSLQKLEHFRDETKATVASLETVSAHAADHPAGFKELQIALREAVRQMDAIIVSLPADKHPWFSAVRSDLLDAQNELIAFLFPKQPGKNAPRNPPAS